MKAKHERSRKSAAIDNSRWLAYATAGAASAFTAANSAEATIHYSGPINKYFGSNQDKSLRFQLDQRGDYISLRHDLEFCCTLSYGGSAFFAVHGLVDAGVAGFYCPSNNTQHFFLSKLKYANFVSRAGFNHARNSGSIATWFAGYYFICNQFKFGDLGYIAFRFNNGSGEQYGWARIKMGDKYFIDNDFRLIDYAYADPGERIRAGQTSSNDRISEEGSLGWLALGAVGVVAWRKRRSTTQAAQS